MFSERVVEWLIPVLTKKACKFLDRISWKETFPTVHSLFFLLQIQPLSCWEAGFRSSVGLLCPINDRICWFDWLSILASEIASARIMSQHYVFPVNFPTMSPTPYWLPIFSLQMSDPACLVQCNIFVREAPSIVFYSRSTLRTMEGAKVGDSVLNFGFETFADASITMQVILTCERIL